jgi:hypothetical protein
MTAKEIFSILIFEYLYSLKIKYESYYLLHLNNHKLFKIFLIIYRMLL